MALPSSGQLSADEVYKERFGDGASPSGSYSMESLQSAWQLPNTPDNTDIFYGKGRPEGSTDAATNVDSYSATLNGTIHNAGGYSTIDCDWRFSVSNGNTTIETVGGNFTGSVSKSYSGLNPDTNYSYQLQCRNIHDNGNWQTYSTRGFTTSPLNCLVYGTEITMYDGSIKYVEDLKVGDKLRSASIEGLRDTNIVDQLFKWESKTMKKLEVPGTIKDIKHKIADSVIAINGGIITATGSHTQLIRRNGYWKFISLEDIRVGDFLYHSRSGLIEVEYFNEIEGEHDIYKLTMEGPTHTFYANRILTHNVK